MLDDQKIIIAFLSLLYYPNLNYYSGLLFVCGWTIWTHELPGLFWVHVVPFVDLV